MSAFTSVKAGDCNDPTVWGNAVGGAVPGVGDTVSIGHAVAVPDGFAWAVGSSPITGGTAAIAVTAGSLTVGKTDGAASPASLRVLGPVSLAATLVATFKAGASLAFDSTASADPPNTKYAWTINNQSRVVFAGTASARCSVSSVSGGGNGFFNGSGSQTGQIQASYTDFLRCGDSSTNLTLATPGASPGGCTFLNCTFNSCGTVRYSDNGGDKIFRFEGNVCTNTAGTTPLLIGSSTAITTGTRTVFESSFDKIVQFNGPLDFSAKSNYFGAGWSATGSSKFAQFDDIFGYTGANVNGNPNWTLSANAKRLYLYVEGGVNPHFIKPNDAAGNLTLDGAIFEYGGTSADGDDFNFGSPTATTTWTLVRAIKLPNAAGLSSGTLFSGLGNANCRIVCEHCTMHGGGGGDSSGGRVGETFPSFTGQVPSMRGNLFWDTTPRGFVFYDMSASPAVDAVTAANCDYNGRFNAATGTCTVNGVATDVPGYRGLNVSGATPPGAHDTTADPKFVDPNRCLRTWDASLGGPGTAANALSRLAANPKLVPVLIAWIQAGFVPTNPAVTAYYDSSHAFPGDTATADAAGNPLNGTLGAMAYAPGGGPAPFFLGGLNGGFRDMVGGTRG